MNGWRAGYSESCKSGSGASARKPTTAMWKGAGYLAYSIPSVWQTGRNTVAMLKAIMKRSGRYPTGFVRSMAYPSFREMAAKENPMPSGRQKKTAGRLGGQRSAWISGRPYRRASHGNSSWYRWNTKDMSGSWIGNIPP